MKSVPNELADSRMYEFWRHCIGQTIMLSHPITHGIDFHWPVRETLDWTEPTKQTFGLPKTTHFTDKACNFISQLTVSTLFCNEVQS